MYPVGVKSGAMKIDETTIAIVKHLRQGRKSFKQIADELSIAENTVRSRVNEMIEEEFLDLCGLVDPEKIPGHTLIIVGVKLNTMDLINKGKEFSELHGVVSVGVVTGRFDLILFVLLNKGFNLQEFYTKEVSRIEDVQSVETFVTYKNYNLKVPYIL